MSSQFQGRSGLTGQAKPVSSQKRAIWIAAGVAIFGLAGGAAYYAYAQMPDPEVARLEEKGKELFQPPAGGDEPITPEVMEERHEQMEEFREEVDQLDESQRDQLREGFGRMMREHFMSEVRRFHTLTPEEQVEFLDEKIDQMEAMRQWGEQRRQQAAAEGDDRPGPPGGPPGGPGGGPPGGGPPPEGEEGQARSQPTPEERQERMEQFRRQFVSDTTPEERAQMAELMDRMNERREERGLEPMPDFGER